MSVSELTSTLETSSRGTNQAVQPNVLRAEGERSESGAGGRQWLPSYNSGPALAPVAKRCVTFQAKGRLVNSCSFLARGIKGHGY